MPVLAAINRTKAALLDRCMTGLAIDLTEEVLVRADWAGSMTASAEAGAAVTAGIVAAATARNTRTELAGHEASTAVTLSLDNAFLGDGLGRVRAGRGKRASRRVPPRGRSST